MNAWLIRHYFTVIHQVSEGHFERSIVPNTFALHMTLYRSLSHTHKHAQKPKTTFKNTHEPTQRNVTNSSKMTAQSGRKRRCVSPAPCIPMKMSELWVIFSCSRKGTSLKKRGINHLHDVNAASHSPTAMRLCGAHSLVFVVNQVDLQERNGLECIHQL